MGPLTSFQSLPFINIYRSSSTKNNILEPREEKKKINAKHQDLGSKSMCARAEGNGTLSRTGCEREHSSGQGSPWRPRATTPWRPATGLAAQNPLL